MVDLDRVESERELIRRSVARIDRLSFEQSNLSFRIAAEQQQVGGSPLPFIICGCIAGMGLFAAGMAFAALLTH